MVEPAGSSSPILNAKFLSGQPILEKAGNSRTKISKTQRSMLEALGTSTAQKTFVRQLLVPIAEIQRKGEKGTTFLWKKVSDLVENGIVTDEDVTGILKKANALPKSVNKNQYIQSQLEGVYKRNQHVLEMTAASDKLIEDLGLDFLKIRFSDKFLRHSDTVKLLNEMKKLVDSGELLEVDLQTFFQNLELHHATDTDTRAFIRQELERLPRWPSR